MYTIQKPAYAYNALEPFIDTRTMELHTEKHHQAYADKLNATLESTPEFQSYSLEQLLTKLDELPIDISKKVNNFAGGVYNHDIFWTMLSPDHDQEISPELSTALSETFESVDAFKQEFSTQAAGLFGSGWTWLVKDDQNHLAIISTPNQDSPLSHGSTPLLGIDVWEHAYYLKYQNKRADYIDAFWHVVNWEEVHRRFRLTTD